MPCYRVLVLALVCPCLYLYCAYVNICVCSCLRLCLHLCLCATGADSEAGLSSPRGGDLAGRLPITLHPRAPGSYPTLITLRSVRDVRVYKVVATVVDETTKKHLEFVVSARQTLSQDIPVVNNSDVEWPMVVRCCCCCCTCVWCSSGGALRTRACMCGLCGECCSCCLPHECLMLCVHSCAAMSLAYPLFVPHTRAFPPTGHSHRLRVF
jgi:hypothetical protein